MVKKKSNQKFYLILIIIITVINISFAIGILTAKRVIVERYINNISESDYTIINLELNGEPDGYNGTVIGLYEHKVGKSWIGIQIVNLTPNIIYGVLQHEIGHFIWQECINQFNRDVYRNIVKDTEKTCPFNNEKKTTENFAESYSCYMTPACKLCPEKDRFFARIYNMYLKCDEG